MPEPDARRSPAGEVQVALSINAEEDADARRAPEAREPQDGSSVNIPWRRRGAIHGARRWFFRKRHPSIVLHGVFD